MHKKIFSPKKQQSCVEVLLEHALHLQAFLTCLESPGGELFPPEIHKQVHRTVWAKGTPGKVVNVQPIKVHVKEGVWVIQEKQYPLQKEAVRVKGIQPVLQKFLKAGLIQPCQSPYNTPILPVKKPSDEYWFVQDLRTINDIVQAVHPTVPNPYTLLPWCLGIANVFQSWT